MTAGTGPAALSLDTLLRWLAARGGHVYLVGGCIRDRLLGRPLHDLDLVVPSGGLALARRAADEFGGDYFALDQERGTGRALFDAPGGGRLVVDVAEFRGPDLPADLAARDFTVNALAEDLAAPGSIIDLFHGQDDLRAKVLRPVGPASIRSDPVRALRAVRLAAELGFSLAPETVSQLRQDGPGLAGAPGERVRDEVSRLLLDPHAAGTLRLLDDLGLLAVLFPELEPLRGQLQPAPHHLPALDHSLEAVGTLECLLLPLLSGAPGGPCGARAAELQPWIEGLGPLAPGLRLHLEQPMGDRRPRFVCLKLAALLHDTGKPHAAAHDAQGRLRFIGHEARSQALAGEAMRRLRFTAPEVRLVETVARHHMRPLLLASAPSAGAGPSARAVYRFFRDTGGAGVDVLLHALADHLAIHRPGTAPQAWQRLLSLVLRLLGDYFLRPAEKVAPPPLLDGHDIQRELGLAPGPRIGELLEAVREAQVSGEVGTREGAFALVRRCVERSAPAGPDETDGSSARCPPCE